MDCKWQSQCSADAKGYSPAHSKTKGTDIWNVWYTHHQQVQCKYQTACRSSWPTGLECFCSGSTLFAVSCASFQCFTLVKSAQLKIQDNCCNFLDCPNFKYSFNIQLTKKSLTQSFSATNLFLKFIFVEEFWKNRRFTDSGSLSPPFLTV